MRSDGQSPAIVSMFPRRRRGVAALAIWRGGEDRGGLRWVLQSRAAVGCLFAPLGPEREFEFVDVGTCEVHQGGIHLRRIL